MTARALLNVIETDMLAGLDPEQRALIRWSVHDPVAFLAHEQEQKRAALEAAGGEIVG